MRGLSKKQRDSPLGTCNRTPPTSTPPPNRTPLRSKRKDESNNEHKFIKMLFDPDKLDDNDPRKIAFLKQQEDQRQRAQKQPADQEVTPTKSAVLASNGNGDEDEEKVHPLNNPVFNEYLEQQQKADQEVSPKESATVSKQKYRSFVKEIEKDQIFGKCIGRVSVVEFQKRGAPHTHTCG
jgi:Rps23 Pro-64 3,4-dihydroxylase Tpa1-like proline 4-hydroxylase